MKDKKMHSSFRDLAVYDLLRLFCYVTADYTAIDHKLLETVPTKQWVVINQQLHQEFDSFLIDV